MKEGDKLYCIKNFEYLWDLDSKWDLEQFIGEEMLFFHPKNTITISNEKGKEYVVETIDIKNNIIYVNSEYNTTPYNVFGFSLVQFNEHFIYGKEYRKFKLEKLYK